MGVWSQVKKWSLYPLVSVTVVFLSCLQSLYEVLMRDRLIFLVHSLSVSLINPSQCFHTPEQLYSAVKLPNNPIMVRGEAERYYGMI